MPDGGMTNRISPVSEQRRAARVPCQMVVRFQNRQELRWDPIPLKDLSQGGARFLSEHLLDTGAVVKFMFGLPLFMKDADVPARVVWKKLVYSGRLQMTEYGVAFTSISPEVRQTLGDTVRRTLASSLRSSASL